MERLVEKIIPMFVSKENVRYGSDGWNYLVDDLIMNDKYEVRNDS